MVSKNKDHDEAARIKAWFGRLNRLKSYSFKVYKDDHFIIDEVQAGEICEETESMEINFREMEKLMKEDVQAFTKVMMSLMN